MILTNLLNFKRACSHDKIRPDIETSYCPDCGKLIKNEWYITRCACCGIKLKTMTKNNKIIPQNHYCSNCGANEYIIEKLDKINFIDINFAALIKKEVDTELNKQPLTTQCWQERNIVPQKLLTLSL